MSHDFRRTDGYEPGAFLEAARDHMRSSLVLFDASPYCYDSAGYLAHLAVELLMKALLLELTGSFPREHSVRRLGKRLETLGATFHPNAGRIPELLDEFNELRYPRPAPEVEIGDDDRDPIVQMYNSLWAAVPVDIRPTTPTSRFVTKGTRVLMRRPKGPSNEAVQPASRIRRPADVKRNVRTTRG